jgi:hypothetical protein
MTLDPRLQDLLERYPDDLDDRELAELRGLAAEDAELEALLDELHRVDAALEGAPDAPTELSQGAWARLAARLDLPGGVDRSDAPRETTLAPPGATNDAPQAWSTGGATPSGSASEAPTAWSTGGATPSGSAAEPPPGVLDLGAARRRRAARSPGLLALAAVLLVAVGFGLRDALKPPPPAFTFKGDGTEGAIRGSLFVQGDVRIEDGARRTTDRPVTFRAVMTDAASLALLETQGGRTFVLWPPPGEEWRVPAGTHLLQPRGGSADYRPGAAGEARYTLLARPGPFDIPPDREVPSPEAFGLAHEGAIGLGDLVVVWEEPDP